LRCGKHGQLLPVPAHSTCTSLNPDGEHILSSLHDKHQTTKHSFLNFTQTHSQNSKQFEKFFNNQEFHNVSGTKLLTEELNSSTSPWRQQSSFQNNKNNAIDFLPFWG
jgi:hypothetical protein